ncbi:MAG: hypothetical protein RML45_00005 [Acetobacteraceae bacterium]|nr:hypothetical protein [Acetobacteraceae bacterium]
MDNQIEDGIFDQIKKNSRKPNPHSRRPSQFQVGEFILETAIGEVARKAQSQGKLLTFQALCVALDICRFNRKRKRTHQNRTSSAEKLP